jgi:hypothetical protein
MALPFTPTKTPEDDYAEQIIITMTCLHELNIHGKFQHIKNRLNSHERMVWFAEFLVAHHVSRIRSDLGFYSRLMQYVGSDFLNGLILSETYRAIRGLLKNNDRGCKDELSNLSDFLGIITTTFNKCKPTEAADIQLVKQQVKAYTVKGRQYMYF